LDFAIILRERWGNCFCANRGFDENPERAL
jgi:hypothetical protein